MKTGLLTHIEAIAGEGKATISGDDYNVVAIVQDTIKSGRSASFYLSSAQARAVREWYWTPKRISASKMAVISSDKKAKMKSELGLKGIGSFRISPVKCECGQTFGAFQFLQQGIREHGVEAVRAIFGLKNSTFFRVNSKFALTCPSCSRALDGGIEYDCDKYGGCCYQDPK